MEDWKEIIELIVGLTLPITAIQIYLQINKIWKRKHEREVAASQSISGLFLLIFTCIVSMTYYGLVMDDMLSLIETSFFFFQAIILMLVSTGLFVRGRQKLNFWDLVKSAFRLERKEANYLIKKFFKPNNAAMIIDILHQLAMIDDHLDEKELELIEAFAKEWNIRYSPELFDQKRESSSESNYIRLRNSVEEYLESSPPREQAAQLKDMMQTMIEADDEITEQEELISSELIGLIEYYLNENEKAKKFLVLVVPQTPKQSNLIEALVPSARRFKIAGGEAYSIGKYHSVKYAEMICQQYRSEHLFTIVQTEDPNALGSDDESIL
ncbi:MAG: hypothetical protein Kapaf2KO_11140 [Candidatus Kapaibacteriales bacterium]